MRARMRLLCIALAILTLPFVALPATAAPTCVDATACAGEATQACGGPSPYGDGWDGFTGAWGNVSGVEYGAGGWDRCLEGDWAVGAFVNMDQIPAGGYQTVQVRFDASQRAARACYVSAGAYGWESNFLTFLCPTTVDREMVPNPGWGSVAS